MRKWIVGLLAMALLLSGCRGGIDKTVQRNVVTEITVTWANGQERHYTAPEKMQAVLYYIRVISSPFDAPQPPQEDSGTRVTITTTRADKTKKVYQQQDDAFFREGDGPWRTIDKEKGRQLFFLLKLLPSDA